MVLMIDSGDCFEILQFFFRCCVSGVWNVVARDDDVVIGSVTVNVVANIERLDVKFDGVLGSLMKAVPPRGKTFGTFAFFLLVCIA